MLLPQLLLALLAASLTFPSWMSDAKHSLIRVTHPLTKPGPRAFIGPSLNTFTSRPGRASQALSSART